VRSPAANAKRITSITDRDINAYGWKGDDRLFFFKDSGGNENFHLFTVDRTGTKQTDLTPMPKVRVDLVDELIDNPTDVLVQMNRRDSTVFDVYRVNVVTGDTTMIARNPGNITGWVPDHEGRIRAALTTDGVNGTVLFRPTEADTFRVIAAHDVQGHVRAAVLHLRRPGVVRVIEPRPRQDGDRPVRSSDGQGARGAVPASRGGRRRDAILPEAEGADRDRLHHVEAAAEVPRSCDAGTLRVAREAAAGEGGVS
jgi:hypothetical protein